MLQSISSPLRTSDKVPGGALLARGSHLQPSPSWKEETLKLDQPESSWTCWWPEPPPERPARLRLPDLRLYCVSSSNLYSQLPVSMFQRLSDKIFIGRAALRPV